MPTDGLRLSISPCYAQQQEFIARIPREGINTTHFVAGRGAGKTTALIVRAVALSLVHFPRRNGVITAPIHRDFTDVIMPVWERIVPRELWTFRRSDHIIEMLNGSRIYLRARHADNPRKEPGRGPSYCWVLHDELRQDRDRRAYDTFLGTLRDAEYPARVCDTVSTPRVGWYHDLVVDDERTQRAHVIIARTSDNPYNHGLDDLLRAQYSPEFAAQELDAQWISEHGRIFAEYRDAMWPDGNRHPARWDPNKPWLLFVDFGVRRSAWLAVQIVGGVEVIVAEWLDSVDNMGTRQAAQHIRAWLHAQCGREHPPTAIYYDPAGNARATHDALSGDRNELTMAFGTSPQFRYPVDIERDKDTQLSTIKARLCDGMGRRHLCVSTHLISDGIQYAWSPDSPTADRSANGAYYTGKRGVLAVFREAAWPERIYHASSDAALADGWLEHALDAMCYGIVCRHRPASTRSPLPLVAA